MADIEARQTPPHVEAKEKEVFFVQSLLTPSDLFHSKPKTPWDREKCLLKEQAGPGIKLRVAGANSWQQYTTMHPNTPPGDKFVMGEIVFDPDRHHLEKRLAYVDWGSMNRLPVGNRKADQDHLNRNAAKGKGPKYAYVAKTEGTRIEDEAGAEEISIFMLPPGMRLFPGEPIPRPKDQSLGDRDIYLDGIANWKTKGRIEVVAKGNEETVKKSKNPYVEGVVTMISHADWMEEGKDGKKLDLGQTVIFSRRNYFEELKKQKEIRQQKAASRGKAA